MKAPDFASASTEVLAFLQRRIAMDLWLVARHDDADWVVLSALDRAGQVADGLVHPWADTFCARMVRGDGPRVAPSVAEVPAYGGLSLPGGRPVGAYVGVPLVDADGRVFGTLCGLHPRPMPAAIVDEQPMLEVLADMLSGLLSAERQSDALAQEAETARAEGLTDPVTGLANRRGWDLALASEDERCRRYGATACVVAIELEGSAACARAQAELAAEPADAPHPATGAESDCVKAARALRQTVRKPDTLARLEDDRFVVLGVECTTAEALALLRRLELGLQGAEVSAALGMAMRNRSDGLGDAFQRALDAMEEHRAARARQ